MKMLKIKLIRSWSHDGTDYEKGEILEVREDIAIDLLKDGTAVVPGTDLPEVKRADSTPASLTNEQVKTIVDEYLKANPPTIPAVAIDTKDNESAYLKTGDFGDISELSYHIYKAGPGGSRASEKLRKWDEKSRLAKTAGHMAEADDEQGGYLVPTEFAARLMEKAQEQALIRPRATFIPMATNSIQIPYVNETTRATTLYGGVTIYRPGEAGSKTASKPALGRLQLTLKKLTGLVHVSDELMEDSPISITPLITRMFTSAIGFWQDEDYINGTGAGQALGVMNSGCLISVAKETGQAAATIVFENIVKMWARLWPPSRSRAVWLYNPDIFPQLATMSMAVGTGGVPVYMPAGGVSGAPYATLMGRPAIPTEHCQTLGTTGDIILGDWAEYLIGGKSGGGVAVASSIHLKFDYDETTFRFVTRYDGQPWWAAALTPKHGTNTLSPFVALATRA